MATWTSNKPSGAGTRRQWILEDRNSLNNLKYHIAEEGCSEVQFDLAKKLLDEDVRGGQSKQAVYWLVHAAQQGHHDALKLLRKCYVEGRGITNDNASEVYSCLTMTPGALAARKAARDLFACLSNGNEHITPKQLEREMRRIYKLQKRRRHRGADSSEESSSEDETQKALKGTSIDRSNGREENNLTAPPLASPEEAFAARITEAQLVNAADNYAQGRLPAVSAALRLTVPHPNCLNDIPCFHRLFFHPILFFTLLYHRLINFIVAAPGTVPAAVRWLLMLLIGVSTSFEHALVHVPLAIYYISFGIMLWSTCRMLKTKHQFTDFRVWSGLFLNYGDHNIEADHSENRFIKNNLKPFFYFFCAFAVHMILYPLLEDGWLPHSELTIVAGVFVFTTLIAFMCTSANGFPDWLVLTSFAVNVLAKYPYEMDDVVTIGWRFLDLKVPTFYSFVIGNGIEFCLNCRTALYLLIPLLLFYMAKRDQWRGICMYVIPHCVTLGWLQSCINASQSATMFGVVRAALGLAGVLLFLPLFGIVCVLIPVFIGIEWMGFTNLKVRLGTTVAALVLAFFASCSLALQRRTKNYVTAIQLFTCLACACVLTYPYMTSQFKDPARFGSKNHLTLKSVVREMNFKVETEQLSWLRYAELCGEEAWNKQNKIQAQKRCSHLNGASVAWDGKVTEVQIVRVTNKLDSLIQTYLPLWLGNFLRCCFGESIDRSLQCDEGDRYCPEMSRFVDRRMHSECTLQNLNIYEYEIHIQMSAGRFGKVLNVVLQAEHRFGNFTQRIVENDHVQFYGFLHNTRLLPQSGDQQDFVLGTSNANVKLSAITCLACQDKNVPAVNINEASATGDAPVAARLRDIMVGMKYLLNVLLNPLVTFK